MIDQPTPASRPRINLTALYGQRVDLRLFVKPGDLVIHRNKWDVVEDVRVLRAGDPRKRGLPCRADWDCILIITQNGQRVFGYPPRTLPKQIVTRKRPLF